MRRIIRNRPLTEEEAEKYRKIRQQVAAELPELVARHHERMAAREQLDQVFGQLRTAREHQGLSESRIVHFRRSGQTSMIPTFKEIAVGASPARVARLLPNWL